jgi:hypothetical protein
VISVTEPVFVADMPLADYVADPCPWPSLDTRTAMALRDRSPLHARWQHPRFNPDVADRHSRKMDIGSAFHSVVLEGRSIHRLVPFDNYNTKKAREFRDDEIANGKVPLLEPDLDKLTNMVSAFKMDGGFDILGDKGTPELSGFFRVGETWCRTRPDWMDDGKSVVRFLSLKTVTGDASREAVERRFHRDGWDLSAALNAEAAASVWQREASVAWLLVEQEPPHAISLHEFNAAALAFSRTLLRRLAATWQRCLTTGDFPGYYDPKKRAEVTYRKYDLDRIRIMAGLGHDDG